LGFAISGKIPIISGFTVFTTGRAWEFIRMACHDNLNLKIITTHGGIVGEDGSTHNALEDLSLMSTLPNLKVLVPVDNIELIQIIDYSLNNKGPFYIRLPRGSFPKIHNTNYNFSIGKPDVLKEGDDICIIGMGYGSILGLKTSDFIEEELKISVKVINLPCIKPIDTLALIKEIKNVKGIVVVEEHNVYCGFGSILSRIIVQNHPIIMKFIGINNNFGESGKRTEIMNSFGLNSNVLLEKVSELLKKKTL